MGHEVTVYSLGDGRDAMAKVEKNRPVIVDGMMVYYFRNLSSRLARNNLYSPYLLPLVTKRNLERFDVIHIHTFRSTLAIPIWYYAKKYGIPYVLQAHGSVATWFQKGMLKRIFDAIWGRRILRDAAKLIALTQTEAEQCKSMGVSEGKIEIVPNGIDLCEFENLPERGEFRRKYGLDSDQKVVLYLGRIHKSKGLDVLVKAFARLSEDFNQAKLVIIGPDEGYVPVLKELINELSIEERVLFTGPLYGEEKIKAYVDADVFVTPSFYGFPVTFLEACACGLPIITTEVGHKLDWLDGQAGLVVPYDKDALGKAIFDILSDEKMRREFGEKGKLLVHEQFNWQRIAEQVQKLYFSCLSLVGREGV